MNKITTEIVADDSQVERTLKKVENQAKKTGKAVDRATGGEKTPAAQQQIQGGLKAGGLGSVAERVGNVAGLGTGSLALAAGAIGVVIQGVTTALEYMRQEVANTAEMLANNVKELQQTFNDQKARHKTELDAFKQLRELNNAGDSPARAILQKQALETLTRTHKGLPTALGENGNITNLDEAERIVMEKQNRELQDNLKQQLKNLNEQQKLWADVRENSYFKSDVAQSGVEIQKISEQRGAIEKQLKELKELSYADLQKDREARQQLKSDQFYENEVKLQKQQLHLQSLKNKGLDEEYARQKAIYDIQNRGLEVNEEAIRRQLALQRANADERFKGDQNKRAEDLKFQAEQKLRTPEQQAIAAALRAAEAAKKASGGGSLTKPEREREEQIAKLNYKLNNLPRLNLGDMSTRTNALTARGGFASGIVRPQADQVNYQIMTNSKRQVALLEQILKETKNGFRI